MQWFGIFIVTILGIIIFSIIISTADIKNVMKNWNARRCDTSVMFTSFLYKPDYDIRSRSQFSSDNFNFCIRRMAKEVGRQGMAPYYSILGQQLNVSNGIAPILNSMRGMISTSWGDFSKIFQEKYIRMSIIMLTFTRIYEHLRFGMGRIYGLAHAAVYAGLSLLATIINTLQLIYIVLIVVLALLAALMPFMFSVLAPFMVLIIIVGAIATSQLSGVATDQPGFCCDPYAEVRMKDGSYKPLYELHIGDELFSEDDTPNIVKGFLYVDAKNTPLVSIGGVLMSDTHRVLYKNEWILAKEHPEKKDPPPGTVLERLICLNTTQHRVPLKTCIVGDWEEVSSDEGRRTWIEFVAKELSSPCPKEVPRSVPLLGSQTLVYNKDNKQWIPLWQVKFGDMIMSEKTSETATFTKVLCIYYGTAVIKKFTNTFISDGVWMKQKDGTWKLQDSPDSPESQDSPDSPENSLPGTERKGFFLVCDSGVFTIRIKDKDICVRDFTEVGTNNLERCYSFLTDILKKESDSI